MNNFARLVLLTYKGSFVSWQGHGYLTRAFLEPLLTVLTVTLAGKFAANPQIAERYVIGMLAFLIAWVVSYGILESFYNERAYGTLSLLILSRARRLTVYYARAGIQWLNGLVTFTTGLVGAWLILGLDLSDVDWVSLVITVAAMIISSTTFALLIANFFYSLLRMELCVSVRLWCVRVAHRCDYSHRQAAGCPESSQPVHTFHSRHCCASWVIRRCRRG